MKAIVIGGGLSGLAAAVELVDAGHEVALVEARPTLGGAVQTLPERDGDPPPPPDNGQHIALGCFTEYLRFLDRIGEGASYSRRRLSLPVVGEDARAAAISRSPLSILRYRHLPPRERLGVVRTLVALRRADGRDDESFGALLRRLGATETQIDRFWDVFVRPALNLRTDEASAAMGAFTVRTALLGKASAADVILPARPLGAMHGEAARRTLEQRGATVESGHRVDSLDEIDADGIVVALPPAESARLLGEPEPGLEPSPIVSVHLLFDRPLLRSPLAALLDSPAHWVFDRGELTGHPPERGQYLTVVSSGVPDLLDVRGKELVDLMAGELTGRLGPAELLWSRVSREPYATVALRPGTQAQRRGTETDHPNVVRAGAWTDTGWPATMEGAVRSGLAAARTITKMRTVGARA
ncbi:MAG TPA: hydroxysqualene dehydroxylase HpnE [Gaiellaceae bacterium]|nr:hydroxysqualene dehydroxylase HpnE [Gaiellaceae bacterium]